MYARYLCSRDALGLKAEHAAGRPSAARDDRVSCIQVIGKQLLRSRDITWHGHLREKVKFLVSVRVLVVVWVMVVVSVMVRVRVEC